MIKKPSYNISISLSKKNMKNITYSSKKQKPRYLGISLFDDIYIYIKIIWVHYTLFRDEYSLVSRQLHIYKRALLCIIYFYRYKLSAWGPISKLNHMGPFNAVNKAQACICLGGLRLTLLFCYFFFERWMMWLFLIIQTTLRCVC